MHELIVPYRIVAKVATDDLKRRPNLNMPNSTVQETGELVPGHGSRQGAPVPLARPSASEQPHEPFHEALIFVIFRVGIVRPFVV